MEQLSWIYFPTALVLGALHALEPGHAKTLTAAYLIGIKGTKKDAFLLGLSVALTHSLVVILISVAALYLGREAFTENVTQYLQLGSGIIVVLLGAWLMLKRYLYARSLHHHEHHHAHCTPTPLFLEGEKIKGTLEIIETALGEKIKFTSSENIPVKNLKIFIERPTEIEIHQLLASGERLFISESILREPHDFLAELEFINGSHREIIPFEMRELEHDHDHHGHDHGHSHAHDIPDYVKRGERPTLWQIFTFGAAGGMIPCPASITVMLLALSVGKVGLGLFTVMGFSLGLAITLVSVGLIVVAGISRIQQSGRFSWLSENAPIISAGVVMLSGFAALIFH
jgi:nickel/cobalt exporter